MNSNLTALKKQDPPSNFWTSLSAVSVRTKIMGIVLGIVFLLGLTIIFQVRTSMRATLTPELEERGASIAGELAARSTDLVLTNNLFALSELVQDSLAHHEEVRYAFVLNPEGQLLAHSFGEGFPPDLISANKNIADERYHVEVLDTEEGLIWDFAVPILDGNAGTLRLGMSEEKLNQAILTIMNV